MPLFHRLLVDSPHKGPVMQSFQVVFLLTHEQADEETIELPVISDAMSLMHVSVMIIFVSNLHCDI